MSGTFDPLSPSSPAADPGELLSWLEELDLAGPIDAPASPAHSAALRSALQNMCTDVPSDLDSQLAAALEEAGDDLGSRGCASSVNMGQGALAGTLASSLDKGASSESQPHAAASVASAGAGKHQAFAPAWVPPCARAKAHATSTPDSHSGDAGPWSMCARVDLADAAFGTARALSNPAFFPTTPDAGGRGAIVVCGTEECDAPVRDRAGAPSNSRRLPHALVATHIIVSDDQHSERPDTVPPTVKRIAAPVRHVAKMHTGSVGAFAAALGNDIVVSRGSLLQLDVQELQGANFTAHKAPIRELAPCPHDERLLASGGFDCRLLVHDLTTCSTVHDLPVATTAVSSVCWHPSEPSLCGWTEDGGSFALFDTRQASVATRFVSPRSALYTHAFGMAAATHDSSAVGTLRHAVVLGYGDATLQLLDLRVLGVLSTTSTAPQLEQVGEVLPVPAFVSTRGAQPFFAFGTGAASGCTVSPACAAPADMLAVACHLPVLLPSCTTEPLPAAQPCGASWRVPLHANSTKQRFLMPTTRRKLKTSGETLPWLDSLGTTDTAGFVTLYKHKCQK